MPTSHAPKAAPATVSLSQWASARIRPQAVVAVATAQMVNAAPYWYPSPDLPDPVANFRWVLLAAWDEVY